MKREVFPEITDLFCRLSGSSLVGTGWFSQWAHQGQCCQTSPGESTAEGLAGRWGGSGALLPCLHIPSARGGSQGCSAGEVSSEQGNFPKTEAPVMPRVEAWGSFGGNRQKEEILCHLKHCVFRPALFCSHPSVLEEFQAFWSFPSESLQGVHWCLKGEGTDSAMAAWKVKRGVFPINHEEKV